MAGIRAALGRDSFPEPYRRYQAELAERIRINQSTLIVPGSQLRLENYFRLWFGAPSEKLHEGLRRIGMELRDVL